MRMAICVAAALLAAGCVPNNVRQNEAAVFDLGVPTGGWAAPLLRSLDVTAPSWLGTTAMQYRLAYSEGMRRRAYADSRWAAPPAELIEQALRRQALAGVGAARDGALGCRLRVEIDEFEQVFDTAQSSSTVLALRASLVSRHEQGIASRAFTLRRPAPSPDARGGVAAAAAALQDVAGHLAAWIAGEKSALAERCLKD